MSENAIRESVEILSRAWPKPLPSDVLVLGSGLGEVIETLEIEAALGYGELSGFPATSVKGHAGRLTIGTLKARPVVVLEGREHYYERGRADAMAVPIRTLRRLGAERLLMTNAAGSLDADMEPGSLMLVSDHINWTGANPLIGNAEGDDRFVDLTNAYDTVTRANLSASAERARIPLFEGVYVGFAGPSFETPAEIRAAKTLGGNAVGMSLVPETILARHCGLNVGAISVMTNYAAGIAPSPLSHQPTMEAAAQAAPRCRAVIEAYFSSAAQGEPPTPNPDSN